MHEMSYRGDWWLPYNSPDDAVAGELTFNPEDGSELQLIGAFREFNEMNTVTEVETIFGVTTEGNRITLKDCSIMLDRIASSSATMRTERCRAKEVFVDGHFDGDVLLDRVYTTVRDIRDARHEIAHGDEEERDLQELHQLSQRMQVIIEVCLLRALGLGEEHIREKMQNNHGAYL